MAKETLGSLISKGLDEKSSALPEAQETKVENGIFYVSERVHEGSMYWWWVPKGPVNDLSDEFDEDGRHWDE